ncbi:hypothetical protein U1Q18_009168 [Sarracenia purpurea var. burkii]
MSPPMVSFCFVSSRLPLFSLVLKYPTDSQVEICWVICFGDLGEFSPRKDYFWRFASGSLVLCFDFSGEEEDWFFTLCEWALMPTDLGSLDCATVGGR